MHDIPKPPLPPPPPSHFSYPDDEPQASPSELGNDKVTEGRLVIPTESGSEYLEQEDIEFLLKKHLRPEFLENPNVRKFIYSYIRCRDTSQAAKEAGLHGVTGKALRKRKDVNAAIVAITAAAVSKYGYDAEEVVEKAKEIMNVDPGELMNPDGTYKTSLSELSPEVRRAIKKFKAKNLYDYDKNGIKVKIGELVEVEFWDKTKALGMLGPEKGVFKQTKVVEHDITSNMKDLLLASRERAELEARRSRGEVLEIEGKVVSEDTE